MDTLIVCGIAVALLAAVAIYLSRSVDEDKRRRREKDDYYHRWI